MLKPVFLQSPCRQQPSWTVGCQKKHKSEKLSAKTKWPSLLGLPYQKNQNIQLNSPFSFKKTKHNKNTFLTIDARCAWLKVWLGKQPKNKKTKNNFFFLEKKKKYSISTKYGNTQNVFLLVENVLLFYEILPESWLWIVCKQQKCYSPDIWRKL